MLHDIPSAMLSRMQYLEAVDAADRNDGTPQSKRLRQIPRDTGSLLTILAASAPEGHVVEIGTSAGYSTLWIWMGCRARALTLTTFENNPEKARLARETFELCGLGTAIRLVEDDARRQLEGFSGISFCFLDAEKDMYADCFEAIVPRLVPGGLVVADNVISHQEVLGTIVNRYLQDVRVDAAVVPIGKGLLLCRRP